MAISKEPFSAVFFLITKAEGQVLEQFWSQPIGAETCSGASRAPWMGPGRMMRLARDAKDSLYGTATESGDPQCGGIFKSRPNAPRVQVGDEPP